MATSPTQMNGQPNNDRPVNTSGATVKWSTVSMSALASLSLEEQDDEQSAAVRRDNLDRLFDLFCVVNDDDEVADRTIDMYSFLNNLDDSGIQISDPRLSATMSRLCSLAGFHDRVVTGHHEIEWFRGLMLKRNTFCETFASSADLSCRALGRTLVVSDWLDFVGEMDDIVDTVKQIKGGKVINLSPVQPIDPTLYGVCVCTTDGQRTAWGDYKELFSLQSIVFVFNYAIALHELGADVVHKYVGMEPSGRAYDDICLDKNKKPHNPIINAGAIVTASLLSRGMIEQPEQRLDYVMRFIRRLAGHRHIGFNEELYKTELATAYRNYALTYYLKEHGCLPRDATINETVDFFHRVCAIEADCGSVAIMAATLASGGVCPVTRERILDNEACRNALSLMFSCGMYSYSGMFAFKIGLPAKASISGLLMVVVPNVCAFAVYSPPLDEGRIPVKGLKFCELLVENFSFHNYDNLLHSSEFNKIDPRRSSAVVKANAVNDLLYAAKAGDLDAMKRFLACGYDLNMSDYDRRTALHVASSEGHTHVVVFLVTRCAANVNAKDRWGHTPLEDADSFGHVDTVQALNMAIQREKRKRSLLMGNSNKPLKHISTLDNPTMNKISEESAGMPTSINLHAVKTCPHGELRQPTKFTIS